MVGQQFALRTHPRRTGTILEIIDKRLFRVRDCIDGMERRFGDESSVRTIATPTDPDGEPDLSAFLRQIEEHSRHAEEVNDWYRDNPVPLFMYAERMGRGVFEAVQLLAFNDGPPLRCCVGAADEGADAISALLTAREIVIDTSALATLHLLQYVKSIDVIGILRRFPAAL